MYRGEKPEIEFNELNTLQFFIKSVRLHEIFGLGLLALIFISGCTPKIAVTPPAASDELTLWREHQDQVAKIESFELKGKVGIKTGEKKGGSATLNWKFHPKDQYIELYGPFGGGRVIITADDKSAKLVDTKNRVIEGDTPEEVLAKRLGWIIPFNELVMWSRGLPNSGATNITFDQNGFLKSLDEEKWHVEYQEYQVSNNFTLPRKLTIDAQPGTIEIYDDDGKYLGDDLNVKVILKRWWGINAAE